MENRKAHDWDKGRWKKTKHAKFDFMTKYIFLKMQECCDFKDKSVLELGCGLGRLSYLCLQNGVKKVTCVDTSEKALSIARQLLGNDNRVSILNKNIFDLDCDKHDIVFSSGLIEHFQDKDRFLIIKKHLEFSKEKSLIIHPSDSLYIRFFSNFFISRKLYGFQKSYSIEELEEYIKSLNHTNFYHKRFYFFYCVPFFHNRKIFNYYCKNHEKKYGGLYISVIE